MPSADSPSLLIVAAEASSSLYALRLLQHWRRSGTAVASFGIGSRAMEAEEFEIIGRAEEMAVVGIQEVLTRYREIRQVFLRLVDEAKKRKPKLALLLDYPDFNLRLAKELKAAGIPVVYYVSPQVWAWRQSRVKLIRAYVDQMLVLFPFEKEFYDAHGVEADFVGHPLIDELAELPELQDRRALRSQYGLQESDTVLALMPGSRHSEVKHNLPVQLETARRLLTSEPDLTLILLVAPTLTEEDLPIDRADLPLRLIRDEPFTMISLADVVLCASGTATLMAGLAERPMVIMYRMNLLTALIAWAFVGRPKHFGLVNLVLDERVAPEFLQYEATPHALCNALLPLVRSEEERRKMRSKLSKARRRLGQRGATERVARILDPYLRRS
jgi:lipid-A-disaccharide synthase